MLGCISFLGTPAILFLSSIEFEVFLYAIFAVLFVEIAVLAVLFC